MTSMQAYGFHVLLVQVHPVSHQLHANMTQPGQMLHPHAQQQPQQARCVQYLLLVSCERDRLYVQNYMTVYVQRAGAQYKHVLVNELSHSTS